jgi:hypothetical protein
LRGGSGAVEVAVEDSGKPVLDARCRLRLANRGSRCGCRL